MDNEQIDAKYKLIEAGTKLFGEKGFTGVSIRELAKEADTNSALISYYFGSKEGLYCAVIEHQFKPIEDVLIKLSAQNLTASERIIVYAKGVMDVHRERPYLIRFMHSELVNPTIAFEVIIKKYIKGLLQFLYKTINDGIEKGEFRNDVTAEHAVLAVAGIMNFYFISRPITKQVFPGEKDYGQSFVSDALKIYFDGVKK